MEPSKPQSRRAAVAAIFWSQFAYWCSVAIAVWAATHLPRGSIRFVLIVTPVIPAVLIFAVTYWLYRACDEYIQKRILQAAAITATGMLLLVTAYYYLQLAGLPPLNLAWISNFGWALFFVQMFPLLVHARR
jgi:small-conductance mechanosensitive channel